MYSMSPSEDTNLIEIIAERISFNKKINIANNDQIPTDHTQENSKLPKDFLVKYDLATKPEEMLPHHINCFHHMAMQDPFTDDHLHIKGSLHDFQVHVDEYKEENINDVEADPYKLVYNSARYVHNMSPLCLYLPRKEILFKLMRACLGVRVMKDIWYERGHGLESLLNSVNTPYYN